METLEQSMQDALNALENSLDPKIWRTKLRIQEIMLQNRPSLIGNPFVSHINHLLTLLVAGVQIGEIIPIQFNNLNEERYEEGNHEPIIMTDIPQDEFYGTSGEFCERIYMNGLLDGLHFQEIKEYVRKISTENERKILADVWKNGLISGRIFYRSVHIPKHRASDKLPALPVMID